MKKLIRIILVTLLFLVSCKTQERIKNKTNNNVIAENPKLDSIIIEHDSVDILYDYEPEKLVVLEKAVVGFDAVAIIEPKESPKLSKKEPPKLNVVDKTDINLDTMSDIGLIAYSVPNEMKVGNSYQIKLRISKQKDDYTKVELVQGDRNISITDNSGNVYIENIRIDETVSVVLVAPDNVFEIKQLSSEWQSIEEKDYTEWAWNVTPKQSGESYMKIIVKIKIVNNSEVTNKDIIVFDKSIKVNSNISYSFNTFISKYWQWFLTTIIIPIFLFFFKRKKKKENEEANQ